tara:strand:- start:452 stop:556 length:105 start_codon:yes stop_codon:yes gene_type:complete
VEDLVDLMLLEVVAVVELVVILQFAKLLYLVLFQ